MIIVSTFTQKLISSFVLAFSNSNENYSATKPTVLIMTTRFSLASGDGTAGAISWMESYYTGGISNPFLTKSKIIAAVFTPVKLVKASV